MVSTWCELVKEETRVLRVWGKDPGFVPGSRMTRLGLCFRKLSDCTPREGPEREPRARKAGQEAVSEV